MSVFCGECSGLHRYMRVLFSSITFHVVWYGCWSSFASTDLFLLQAQHNTMLSLWVSYRDIAHSENTSAAFQHSCTQAGILYGTNSLDICCEIQHHLPFQHLDYLSNLPEQLAYGSHLGCKKTHTKHPTKTPNQTKQQFSVFCTKSPLGHDTTEKHYFPTKKDTFMFPPPL